MTIDPINPREHLVRVRTRIQGHVRLFFVELEKAGRVQFHMQELENHVRRFEPMIAPGSTSRILRDMRQRKVIDYYVISRSESLYQLVSNHLKESL